MVGGKRFITFEEPRNISLYLSAVCVLPQTVYWCTTKGGVMGLYRHAGFSVRNYVVCGRSD